MYKTVELSPWRKSSK